MLASAGWSGSSSSSTRRASSPAVVGRFRPKPKTAGHPRRGHARGVGQGSGDVPGSGRRRDRPPGPEHVQGAESRIGASDQELTGRVAIVTGAGAGIGAGIAAMLAEAGAAVTVADIDGERAASTAKAIEKRGGRAITVTADVSEAHEIDALVRQTVTDLGGIDILVNNAGIATTELVEDLDEEKWRGVLDVNLTGPFLCCKAVLPYMRRKGWGIPQQSVDRRSVRRSGGTSRHHSDMRLLAHSPFGPRGSTISLTDVLIPGDLI